MRNALAILHVAFEDLGSLETELLGAGFSIDVREAACVDLHEIDVLTPDLVVVLGGPIGVYEQRAFPFLQAEIDMVRARLEAERPTLGVCLGAQIMAAALGARVYPGAQGKEIAWGKLKPSAGSGAFDEFLRRDPCVLHWHGDTFDLPPGARLLASTEKYVNQAFAIGDFALALQFHLEVTLPGLERWYVGHACELAQAGIDVSQLRAESHAHVPTLEDAARSFLRKWLKEMFTAHTAPDRPSEERRARC
jgi:GMP synthase (glutamine-hydrolysing)